MTIRKTSGMVLGLVLAAVLAACSTAEAEKGTPLQPSDRYVHVQATELDTRRTLDQNAFPQATLDEFPEYFGEDGQGGAPGYYLFMSGDEEWRIGSYMYLPQEVTFIQGDRVTMDVFGVRGSEHHTMLVGPDGFESIEFTVGRGELHQIEFTVDQPGLYQLICLTHPPTMVTNIHVWPTG